MKSLPIQKPIILGLAIVVLASTSSLVYARDGWGEHGNGFGLPPGFDSRISQGEPEGLPGMGPGQRPQGGQFGQGKNPQGPGKFLEQLGLAEEQKEKLKAILQSNRQGKQGNRQAMQAKRQQLMQMLKTGSGSREQALALHQELSRQQSEMMAQRIRMAYDIRAILTPEQFSKFQALMQQQKGPGGPGGQKGFPGGKFPGRKGGNMGMGGQGPGQGMPSFSGTGE